jgi:hypothetical protein
LSCSSIQPPEKVDALLELDDGHIIQGMLRERAVDLLYQDGRAERMSLVEELEGFDVEATVGIEAGRKF